MSDPRQHVDHIKALLKKSMCSSEGFTSQDIEEVLDILWHCVEHEDPSGVTLTRNLETYAAAAEYLWHEDQGAPPRTRKEVARAHGVSVPSVSNAARDLGLMVQRQGPGTAPMERHETLDSTRHVIEVSPSEGFVKPMLDVVRFDAARPEWIPSRLAAMCEDLERLRRLCASEALHTRLLGVRMPEGETFTLELLSNETMQGVAVFDTLLASASVTLPHDRLRTAVLLEPLEKFDGVTLAALTREEIAPVGDAFYPCLYHGSHYDGPPDTLYTFMGAMVGASVRYLELAGHADADTECLIRWSHPSLGKIHVFEQESATGIEAFEEPVSVEYYVFEVTLRHTKPRVWRRFRLRADATFLDLHDAIQDSMAWYDCHLWRFTAKGDRRPLCASDEPDYFWDNDWDEGGVDAEEMSLSSYFGTSAAPQQTECDYVYDFGDDWAHRVVLCGMESHPASAPERSLIAGAGVAPPENCGGIPGYQRLMDAVRTGRDPWGEGIRELRESYEFEELKSFDLVAQQRYFDTVDEEVPEGLEGELDAMIQHHIASHGARIHEQHRAVYALVAEYGVQCSWFISSHRIAAHAWSYAVELGVFKPRKPAIYAAALVCAIGLELEEEVPSMSQVASDMETSTTSINTVLTELFEIVHMVATS